MSDSNDPFAAFGSDRTIIKPSAGRAPRAGAAAPAAAAGAGRAPAPAPAARGAARDRRADDAPA